MKCISLKLEEEQLEKLKQMVRESGKNRSELIRNKIFNSDTSDTGGDTSNLKNLLQSLFVLMDTKMDFTTEPNEVDDQLIDKVMTLLGL